MRKFAYIIILSLIASFLYAQTKSSHKSGSSYIKERSNYYLEKLQATKSKFKADKSINEDLKQLVLEISESDSLIGNHIIENLINDLLKNKNTDLSIRILNSLNGIKHINKNILINLYTNCGANYRLGYKTTQALEAFSTAAKLCMEIQDTSKYVVSTFDYIFVLYEIEYIKGDKSYTFKADSILNNLSREININRIDSKAKMRYFSGVAGKYSLKFDSYFNDRMRQKSIADSCIKYFNKQYLLAIEMSGLYDAASAQSNTGVIYYQLKNPKKAIYYFSSGLNILLSGSRPDTTSPLYFNTLLGLSNSYLEISKINHKQIYIDSAEIVLFKIANRSLFPANQLELYLSLSNIYEEKGEFKKSLIYFKRGKNFGDSIMSIENSEKIQDFFKTNEILERNLTISNLEKDNFEKDAEINRNQRNAIILISLIGIALLVSLFLFIGFKLKSNHNKVLGEQKAIIEQKNEQLINASTLINDSIKYAKLIQEKIIINSNNTSYLKNLISYSNVVTKDEIGGDFTFKFEDQDNVVCGVCDCTGHGIPGSLITIYIYKIIKDYETTLLTNSLDTVIDGINAVLHKITENNIDNMISDIGMELSIIKYNRSSNILSLHGGKLPFVLFSKSGVELIYNKKIISKESKMKIIYTLINRKLEDDVIVLAFSDGLYDIILANRKNHQNIIYDFFSSIYDKSQITTNYLQSKLDDFISLNRNSQHDDISYTTLYINNKDERN